MKRLLIDLPTLAEEGQSFAGELSEELFNLPEGDATPTSPLRYDVHVQRFESELFITGSLSASFEFICVRTIHPFIQTIKIDGAALSIEIGNESIMDVTDALREEILIQFPANPRCEDGDDHEQCEIDSRYLAVDKPDETAVDSAPRAASDDRWSALDALDNLDSER